MTDIIVGCPVANRSWILPTWKKYVDAAIPESWNLHYIFAVPMWDEETLELLGSWENTQIIPTEEPQRKDVRDWANTDSFTRMADLRNHILKFVRQHHPDFYLSLDSDILLRQQAFDDMYETLTQQNCNAVSSITYLDPTDASVTNAANWRNPSTFQQFKRIAPGTVVPAGILMAINMMDNLAYNVNYDYHYYGEDFGWSKNAANAGLKMYIDGRTSSKHVMYPEWLEIEDKRVGY